MKINKPKFWDKKINFFALILLPLSLIVKLMILIKKNFIVKHDFDIPIVCVGNIYIGGTGKTPISIELAKELSILNIKPVIVRKYYKTHQDEFRMITENTNLILKKKRIDSINQAIKEGYDLVLLDDGFQDYSIKKDLNILCFNENQLIGNGLVIPSGPLREDLSSVKNAQIVIINGFKNISFEEKILKLNSKISFFYCHYEPLNLKKFKNKNFIALSGIGNPNNFFNLLLDNGIKIKEKLIYPDHYKFTKKEIIKIVEKGKKNNCEVIMTEKDYFRIKDYNINNINYLKVKTIIKNKEKLIKEILQVYEKSN